MDQETPSANLFDLQLDQQATAYLSESARWARFLSILGFIMCGLLVLAGVFMGSVLSTAFSGSMGAGSYFGGAFFTVIYIVFALVYFFPCLYLFQFGAKMRMALRNNDQELLSESLKNLKSCFKFFGILAIIVLGLYALALVAVVIGAAVGR
jgi:uncharacterized membrane protein SirB2